MAKYIPPLLPTALLASILTLPLPGSVFSANAQAEGFTGPKASGFMGPGPGPATVEQVLCMGDDSNVHLQGRITKNLGPGKYIFKDKTGIIFLEIDDANWNGQQVGPDDVVDIYGWLGKDWTRVEVAVRRIVKK